MGTKTLSTLLNEFTPTNTVESLTEQFKEIARLFLAGYFEVKGKDDCKRPQTRKIIPLSIEFYYHEENGEQKDWIMYHRNTKSNSNILYSPIGSLNTHVSGIDISFEKNLANNKSFRASILIRKFKVIDSKGSTKEYSLNITDEGDSHSTKMCDALFMGFSFLDGEIQLSWEDPKTYDENAKLYSYYRKNVAVLDENRVKAKAEKDVTYNEEKHVKINGDMYLRDKRKWQFSLKQDDIV